MCSLLLDKSAYFPGEKVLAKLVVNNTSVTPVYNITVNVNRVANLKATKVPIKTYTDTVYSVLWDNHHVTPFCHGER